MEYATLEALILGELNAERVYETCTECNGEGRGEHNRICFICGGFGQFFMHFKVKERD